MTIYVRFAPSPTGLLHVGNIRAALFNFLFARHHGGRFLLRMDDTDQERSKAEYETAIKRNLKWLGITWDEEARQSTRMDRYSEILEKLKTEKRVYPCFETQEELGLKRKTQLGRGLPPVYDRGALNLSAKEIEEKLASGQKPHWRFKLDHIDVKWEDAIQKSKSFPASSISDPVIVREDGVPLYTFCSVIDDADMDITHIIRGEDHVTNTAVQLQLWDAITDKRAPEFAHFPLLVSADGKEMSKRLGSLSIGSMRDDTHIEAMAVNSLLAKLGTSDPIAPYLDMDKLAASFDLSKISRATPKFDMKELKHLSAKILHNTPYENIKDKLAARGLGDVTEALWSAIRGNLELLEDAGLWLNVTNGVLTPLCEDKDFLEQATNLLPPEPWDQNTWKTWTDTLKQKTGRKGKELFMPLRLALTAEDHGPELKLLLPLIGRTRTLARLTGEKA